MNEGAPKKLFLPSVMDGGIPGEPVVVLQGAKLLLQFWVDVLEVDFREWFDYCSKNNRYYPFALRFFLPSYFVLGLAAG